MQLSSIVHETPPNDFLELIWRVFFSSRNRGISLREHFPWMTNQPVSGTQYVCLHGDGGVLVGGLVLRVRRRADAPPFGMIGLVCIDEVFRGNGHSQTLLRDAEQHAVILGCSTLTLWTGKPGVYKKRGYRQDGEELFGWAQAPTPNPFSGSSRGIWKNWPGTANPEPLGLPPFSQAGHLLTDPDLAQEAHAIVLNDKDGQIVVQWQGDESIVVRLLASSMPPAWRLNALGGDRIIKLLAAAGFKLDIKPSGLRMSLQLNPSGSAPTIPPPEIRILERL